MPDQDNLIKFYKNSKQNNHPDALKQPEFAVKIEGSNYNNTFYRENPNSSPSYITEQDDKVSKQTEFEHSVFSSVLSIVAVIALFGYLSRNYQKIVDFFQEKKASNDRANIYEKAQADYLHTKIISEMAKEDTKFELAAKMKKEGLDAEMIKRLTHLSDEDIANL